MIQASDKTGSLEKILLQLKNYLETKKKIRTKLTASLIYPLLIFITSTALCALISFYVFPKLKEMFSSFDAGAVMQIEENISDLQKILAFFIVSVIFIILSAFIIYFFKKKYPSVKILSDTLLINLPFIKKQLILYESMNFSFSMEVLTAGGFTVKKAMELSSESAGNEIFKSSIKKICSNVESGKKLSSEFAGEKLLPKEFSRWILTGEKAGKAKEIFEHLRKHFQDKFETGITKLMLAAEPSLIMTTGFFILMIVLKIIVPLFSLYGTSVQ